MTKYSIQLAWSAEDQAYIACVPELPGCKADGPTPAAALEAAEVVIAQWIEVAKEEGRPIPKPFTQEQFEKAQKEFRSWLDKKIQTAVEEAVTSAVEAAVRQVLTQVSAKGRMLAGHSPDPADFWKRADC